MSTSSLCASSLLTASSGRLIASRKIIKPFSALRGRAPPRVRSVIRAAADSTDVGAAGTAAIALGLLANPIVLWSEFTLKTTGAGLQGDALGAAEGVSYLVVLAIVAWSAAIKAQTGSGLPAGPSGLLGAVEGFSYLSLLGGIIVFGLKAAGI